MRFHSPARYFVILQNDGCVRYDDYCICRAKLYSMRKGWCLSYGAEMVVGSGAHFKVHCNYICLEHRTYSSPFLSIMNKPASCSNLLGKRHRPMHPGSLLKEFVVYQTLGKRRSKGLWMVAIPGLEWLKSRRIVTVRWCHGWLKV